MTKTEIIKEWEGLLSQTMRGRSKEAISEFDRLTSLLASENIIDFDTFLMAQTIIAKAKQIA